MIDIAAIAIVTLVSVLFALMAVAPMMVEADVSHMNRKRRLVLVHSKITPGESSDHQRAA